ncbi:hypothetical protein PENTCL1PPCAC_14695 [Pristionchus entomophagus]|uniref:G protein-coupled receptor n=1 Tax=Pristionchus entomophagus TaxID=358040 RepID=A0AAV5TG53_9BILA|nr:hypothetical protein PENTCL1PPCAC_14695 [Pristionchus entomophagus]
MFLLKDTEVVEEPNHGASSKLSSASIKEQFGRVRKLNLPWIIVALAVFEKMVATVYVSTMGVVIGPMMTAMYALDGLQIVLVLGISQIVVGILAVGFALAFALCKIGNRISCRVLFVFSNMVMVLGYLISYPFPFDSSPLQRFNETTGLGCDPSEYSWCDSQLVVSIIPLVITLILSNALALPSAGLSLDTIYSKIIGNIDQVTQNIMQAIFVVSEDIMLIVGPIYGT